MRYGGRRKNLTSHASTRSINRADATPPVRLGPRVPLAAIRQLGQNVAAALLRVEELLGPPLLARAPPQLVIGRRVAERAARAHSARELITREFSDLKDVLDELGRQRVD